MRIFRIQNHARLGICVADTGICDAYHKACGLPMGCAKHSSFGEERALVSKINLLLGWQCAFSSKAALLSWFPEETGRSAMKIRGAYVVELEVPEDDTMTTEDGEQVIYEPFAAEEIACHDITQLEA